jgi:hypothetical protein
MNAGEILLNVVMQWAPIGILSREINSLTVWSGQAVSIWRRDRQRHRARFCCETALTFCRYKCDFPDVLSTDIEALKDAFPF